MPGTAKDQIRTLARAYATTVAQQEWPKLADGKNVPDDGWTQLDQLRVVLTAAPVDGQDSYLAERKTAASDDLRAVYEARQRRLGDASGIGRMLWAALILGSLITALVLPNLFGGTRRAAHIIIVSTLAGTITLLLFAIYQLQNPYGAGAHVPNTAFTAVLARLG